MSTNSIRNPLNIRSHESKHVHVLVSSSLASRNKVTAVDGFLIAVPYLGISTENMKETTCTIKVSAAAVVEKINNPSCAMGSPG